MHRILVCAIVLAGFSFPADAGMDEALEALRNRNHAGAIPHLEAASKDGNVRAQLILGQLYFLGAGTAKNPAAAAELFTKIIDENTDPKSVPTARRMLASLYWGGSGVEQDRTKAAELYVQAARDGDSRAQGIIAGLYATGNVLRQDLDAALKWVMVAAANGNQSNYGILNRIMPNSLPQQLSAAYAKAKKEFPSLNYTRVAATLAPWADPTRVVLKFGVPDGWNHVFSGANGLKEYVPAGQSVTDWTDMLTVREVPRAVGVVAATKRLVQQYQKTCGKVVHKLDPRLETDPSITDPYVIIICDNPKRDPAAASVALRDKEILWNKYIKAPDRVYVLQRAYHHNHGIADQEVLKERLAKRLTEWDVFFQKVTVCDSTNPQPDC